MAALTGITAVRPTSNTKTKLVQYGATVSAGQPLYQDAATTDQPYKPADSNASAATAEVRGIAITPGVSGGWGLIAVEGSIILVGTTTAAAVTYYVGATAGTIVPESDLTTGDYNSRIGVGNTTSPQIDLSIQATGVVRP